MLPTIWCRSYLPSKDYATTQSWFVLDVPVWIFVENRSGCWIVHSLRYLYSQERQLDLFWIVQSMRRGNRHWSLDCRPFVPWLCCLRTVGKRWILETKLDQQRRKMGFRCWGANIFHIYDHSIPDARCCVDSWGIEHNLVAGKESSYRETQRFHPYNRP